MAEKTKKRFPDPAAQGTPEPSHYLPEERDAVFPGDVRPLPCMLLEIQKYDRVLSIGAGAAEEYLQYLALFPTPAVVLESVEIARKAAERYVEDSGCGAQILSPEPLGTERDGKKVYERQFDRVFVNCRTDRDSIGIFLGESDFSRKGGRNIGEQMRSPEWALVKAARMCVNGPGNTVCLMPADALSDPAGRAARRELVQGGSVKTVVLLPKRLFGAADEGTALVVLSHGNLSVKMVDASDMYEKERRRTALRTETWRYIRNANRTRECKSPHECIVSSADLAETRWNFRPTEYIREEAPAEGVPLGELVAITRGAPIGAMELDDRTVEENTGVVYVGVGDIHDGIIDKNLPYLRELEAKLRKYCVQKGDILLAKTAYPVKAAVAEPPENVRLLATSNLYILTVKDGTVDPYYLAAYFDSAKGAETLRQCATGSHVSILTVNELKNLRVPMHSKEMQKNIAAKYRSHVRVFRELTEQAETVRTAMQSVFDEDGDAKI